MEKLHVIVGRVEILGAHAELLRILQTLVKRWHCNAECYNQCVMVLSLSLPPSLSLVNPIENHSRPSSQRHHARCACLKKCESKTALRHLSYCYCEGHRRVRPQIDMQVLLNSSVSLEKGSFCGTSRI